MVCALSVLCTACGMLAHLSCLGSTSECPRCSNKPLPDFIPWQHGGIRRAKFEKGTIRHPPVGLEKGSDPRLPCSLLERPSDAEAKAAGFKTAKEWYVYSAGGACIAPDKAESNFNSLPPVTTSSPSDGTGATASGSVGAPSPETQWWTCLQDSEGVTAPERGTAPVDLIEDEPSVQPCDTVARLAEEVGAMQPYLIADVECYHQDRICDLREETCQSLSRLVASRSRRRQQGDFASSCS